MARLQAAAIATGFPFAIVLVLMCVSIFIGLGERKTSPLNLIQSFPKAPAKRRGFFVIGAGLTELSPPLSKYPRPPGGLILVLGRLPMLLLVLTGAVVGLEDLP